MSLNLHVGELQRVVAQVEADIGEAEHYPPQDRQALASALTDLACRLELARIAILDREPVEAPRQ